MTFENEKSGPAAPARFRSYPNSETVPDGMVTCRRIPQAFIQAKKMTRPFSIEFDDGTVTQHEAGDFLIRSAGGKYFALHAAVFEAEYEYVSPAAAGTEGFRE